MKKLIKTLLSPEMLRYLITGAATTAVSLFTYSAARLFGIGYQGANVVSWICAVTFAFGANKFFVFRSSSLAPRKLLREAAGFYGARLATLLLEMAVMWLMVDVLSIHDMIAKLVCQVLLIIGNYAFSKFVVFQK